MSPLTRSKYERVPVRTWVFLGVAALALFLQILGRVSPVFSERFQSTVGAFFRTVTAHITSWLPFSLAEILVLFLPVALVALTVYAYRRRCENWRAVGVYALSLVAAVSLLYSLFVFSFGLGYTARPLAERLDLEEVDVTPDELYATAVWLAEAVNDTAAEVTFGEDGFSVMPYDRAVMNEKLLAAYRPVCEQYPFVQSMKSRVKPVLFSKALSYTHVTGLYTFFTGEANVNTAFPDYTLPYTAAHELAHQRGIAREDEANFIAFLATSAAADPYLRYSGYLNLFEYVASALYGVDEARYREVIHSLSDEVIGELHAYSAFFDTYREAAAARVSDTVNDAYLKLHGSQAGNESYGLVTTLAVAYRHAR